MISIQKNLLVYDGECTFCKMWVNYLRILTKERVEYRPFQSFEWLKNGPKGNEVAKEFPDIPQKEFARTVRLFTPDGGEYSGAEAIFRVLAFNKERRIGLWLYKHIPGFKFFSELGYRFVASHRRLVHLFSRVCIGKQIVPLSYTVLKWFFFRLLAVVYFLAILSFMVQMIGLIGPEGILPLGQFFDAVSQQVGSQSLWIVPSLFWISTSSTFLYLVAFVGLISSLLLFFRVRERTNLVILFAVYLSFVSAGQIFMSYQWDVFLLEVGFLAILFSLWQPIIWLLRFLLFKVIFLSGLMKLLSGDPTWRDLSALTYHYMTQPLPTPLAWYVHNLPAWIHEFSVVLVLISQIIIAFFIFAPRRLRHFTACTIIGVEVLILLTGNYSFFNILTITLALLLFDDQLVKRFIPAWISDRIAKGKQLSVPRFGRIVVGTIAAMLVFVSIFQMFGRITGSLPQPLRSISGAVQPLHIVNNYGLFAVMTTSRHEIIIEGSYDKEIWIPYEFKYKPGKVHRSLPLVAPHQPRLDWQMWFASLRGNYQNAPWTSNFALRLLEGSPSVVNLLETNPFPDKPPTFIRALVYNYEFTTKEEREVSGNIWKREFLGLYLPPASLRVE
ncbi:membrane protein [Candidatus Wolfebacteria bacterium]|nr:MAG: membrane protein [Candidatus Wolfebacteria bacterium]